MNNLTKEIVKYATQELQKGYSLEKIAEDIIKNSEDFCDNIFDFSNLKDYFQFIIILSRAKEPEDDFEKHTAFENTLKAYDIDNIFMHDELKMLTRFDKIIYENDEPRLAKLNMLFTLIIEHIQMLEELYEIKNNLEQKELSLITSKSEKNEELVDPKINTLKKAYKITKSDEILDHVKIYEKFKSSPLETDMVLNLISSFPNEKIKDDSIINIEAMKQARTIVECNDINFNENKIIESISIYIFSIYKKDSYINRLLQIKKELSRSKVAKIANILLSNLFENIDFNYRHTHVVKATQHYSYFLDYKTPLLEFRNSINHREHPFLEKDVDEELLSFFKSK